MIGTSAPIASGVGVACREGAQTVACRRRRLVPGAVAASSAAAAAPVAVWRRLAFAPKSTQLEPAHRSSGSIWGWRVRNRRIRRSVRTGPPTWCCSRSALPCHANERVRGGHADRVVPEQHRRERERERERGIEDPQQLPAILSERHVTPGGGGGREGRNHNSNHTNDDDDDEECEIWSRDTRVHVGKNTRPTVAASRVVLADADADADAAPAMR
jgi:hypothetical protein